jgi:hypothetical protein
VSTWSNSNFYKICGESKPLSLLPIPGVIVIGDIASVVVAGDKLINSVME